MSRYLKGAIPVFAFAALLLPRIAHAQYTNVRVSDTSVNDRGIGPEEVSIALNPKNPNELAAGANVRYFYRSTDAGLSWTTDTLNSQYAFWGDPCLLFDDSGILYYEHLSGYGWQDPEFLFRIVVQRSTDAGKTFDDGEQIGYAPPTMQDKAWLGLDRTKGAANGTLYTSWTEFDRYGSDSAKDSSRIYFSKSADHSLTWSDRVRVDDRGGDCLDGDNTDEGATSAVGSDGAINVAWAAREQIYLARSTDGGKSFGKSRVIATQPGGWDFDVPGIYRANGMPMLLSDLNPSSAYYGSLYLLWSDQRRGVTDVYFSSSKDNGTNWSEPLRVNTDSTFQHHFFPSMTLDPVTGRIYVVFYDRRNYTDIADVSTDVYLARSTDGGASFTDERISESAFQPAAGVFFGDYIHIVAYDGHVYPIWMRMDDAALSVWTAIANDTAKGAPSRVLASDGMSELRLWATGTPLHAGLAFQLPDHTHASIELWNMLGERVASLLDGEYGQGDYRIGIPSWVANGSYIARLITSGGTVTTKIAVASP